MDAKIDEAIITALASLMRDEKYDAMDLYIRKLYSTYKDDWVVSVVEAAKFLAYGDVIYYDEY